MHQGVVLKNNLVILVFCCLFLSSCGFKSPKLPSARKFNEATQEKKETIVRFFHDRASEKDRFQGNIEVQVHKGVFKKKANLALAYEYPDSIRAEILPTSLATPAVLVVGKASNLSVVHRDRKKAWMGPVDPDKVERIIGLPLEVSEVIRWFSAAIPFPGLMNVEKLSEQVTVYLSEDDKTGLLYVPVSEGREFRFLLENLREFPRIVSMDLISDSKTKIHTIYEYSEDHDFPKSSKTWMLDEEATFSLDGAKNEINPEWQPETLEKLFRIKVPRNFERRALSDFERVF